MSVDTMRKILIILALICTFLAGWNYLSLQKKLTDILKSDPRNEGVSALIHYEGFINPRVIIIDIRDVKPDKSPMDVSRVLLQLSKKLKNNEYQEIKLSFRGKLKFKLKGSFFSKIGMEYGIQNPVYTLRSLPQNVYNLDGTQAFSTWTGGLIGVVGKQMEDLSEFHKQWYINDLATGH